jgi:hypothetical protein
MKIRLERFSYRFAEQVLNSKLAVMKHYFDIVEAPAVRVIEHQGASAGDQKIATMR